MANTENTRAPAGAILYEHEDGRYAVAISPEDSAFTNGKPKWHRVGPVEVHGASPDHFADASKLMAGAPAGGGEPTAMGLRWFTEAERLISRYAQACCEEADDGSNRLVAWSAVLAHLRLASAPASAPLPIRNLVSRLRDKAVLHGQQMACGSMKHAAACDYAEVELIEAIAREPSFDAWWPTDPVARAHADNSRDLALIEHGWRGRASVAASSHQAAPSGSGEVDGSDTRTGGE